MVSEGRGGRRPSPRQGTRPQSAQRKVRGIVLVNVLARASLSEFPHRRVRRLPRAPGAARLDDDAPRLHRAPRSETDGERRRIASEPCSSLWRRPARRVLLAEDNEINSLLAKRVLEKVRLRVCSGANGADAVAAVAKHPATATRAGVDLILMDIFMPQLDGLEAARAIKDLYAARPGVRRRRRSSR